MKLFDSHCHLHDIEYQKDMEEVIQRATEAGVLAEMIVGFNLKSSRRAVALARTRSRFFASVGVHPHDAKSCSTSVLEDLKTLTADPSVHAWGEIGLDFNRMFSPRDIQEKWFRQQLEIIDELSLPVILHERDSEGRFLDILKENHNTNRKGVVHCFSGTTPEMEAYLDLGYHIGITGIITIAQRGKTLRKQAPLIPADRLLIETDAPFLTPVPFKNKTRRNEPAFVHSVMLKLAEVRGEDPEGLSETIWENTCRLYDINPEKF